MTAFLSRWFWLQVILGWPVIVALCSGWPWSPDAILSAVVLEVCLVGLAYLAADAEVWWQRMPRRWE